MNEREIKSALFDKTVAEVTFANGHTMKIASDFTPAQNSGNSYLGADWTTLGQFQTRVETQIREAQQRWGLPSAEVRYFHTRRRLVTLERRIDTRELASTRTVQTKEKP